MPRRRDLVRAGCVAAGLAAVATAVALMGTGCQGARDRDGVAADERRYPPAPQTPRVVALGTLRGTPAPSQAEIDLAMFLFGAPPPNPLVLVNPTCLTAAPGRLVVCDTVLGGILEWRVGDSHLHWLPISDRLDHPFGVAFTPAGHWLVGDRRGVHRLSPAGEVLVHYVLPEEEGELRPGGMLAVDDAVWISNVAMHRIEVFDLQTGAYRHAIGRRGNGPGEFVIPRALARRPDGTICVLDMLNNRVQVLDTAGNWLLDIGQGGTSTGTFGRPKDVAVGPDGTVFVSDAFSQRIHAFSPTGQPLLAFGEPGSGVGALTLPFGLAITNAPPPGVAMDALAGESPACYVLVAEQLDDPGIRAYAWLGGHEDELAKPPTVRPALSWEPAFPGAAALNPHWRADRCDECHQRGADGELLPIPLDQTDPLCLSCHDGVRAPADPHPIGRPADTKLVSTPDDWPTPDGAVACMTCHDIIRHCDKSAQRPEINSVLLRGYDPQQPLEYCQNCHISEAGRFSPHQQRDAQGRVRDDACFFCHTERPPIPVDGERQFEPHLRVESSDLCLNCHEPHWDLSPEGHVDRPVTPQIRQWMVMRELWAEAEHLTPTEIARIAAQQPQRPALLPLGEGMVTCYTCHNPHYNGLFPPDSEVGALADNPADRRAALRTDWIDLCSQCHHH